MKFIYSSVFFLILIHASLSSFGNRIYVDSANTGFQDGTSWGTAYSSFSIAVNASAAKDTIWVARGTYQPSLNNVFTLKDSVKFFGGFKNTDTAFSQRSFTNNPTILKGNGNFVISLYASQLISNQTILDGFTIADGVTGLAMNNASPIIRNCIIRNNIAERINTVGGAVDIKHYNSHPIFENCIFSGNQSTYAKGGAIWIEDGQLTINNSSFLSNRTRPHDYIVSTYGGAIYGKDATINISNTAFVSNSLGSNRSTSGYYGGAIFVEESILNVVGSSFSNNEAVRNGANGGAICGFRSVMHISNSLFENNKAAIQPVSGNPGGGAIYNGFGSEHLINNTFVGNTTNGIGGHIYILKSEYSNPDSTLLDGNTFSNGSARLGGSIYLEGASLARVYNAVFNNNSAFQGGAIYAQSNLLLTNTLFCGNTADSSGAAIHNKRKVKMINTTISKNKANIVGSAVFNVNANTNVVNSIIWGNANTAIFNDGSSLTTASYSLVQGFNVHPANHILAGTTNPLFVDTASNDFRLTSISPCVNAGNVDSISTGTLTDLDNNTRIYGSSVDLGAYEHFFATPIVQLGNDTAICIGDSLRLDAGNPGSDYLWSNSQTSKYLVVTTPGTYYVRVSNIEGVSFDTIVITTKSLPIVALGNDTSFCKGNALVLNANNTGATFLWNTNQTSQTISVDTSGLYIVKVKAANGCVNFDSVNIVVHQLPVVNIGNDTGICIGNSIQFNAQNAGSTILWNTGAVTSTITTDTAGMYIVAVTDSNNCTNSDTVILTINALPVVNLGNDTIICANNWVTLEAGNLGERVWWSTGERGVSIYVRVTSTVSVEVTGVNNCIQRDTISIIVSAKPQVDLGRNTEICSNDDFVLNAGNSVDSFIWNTGATSRSIRVDTTGIYSVTVIDSNGCTNADTVSVRVNQAPIVNLGNDTTAIVGKIVTLNAGNGGASYVWSTGARIQQIGVTQSGTYSVSVTNAVGCIGRDTIVVTFINDNTSIDNPTVVKNQIKLYPNPANTYLTIKLNLELYKDKEAVITDILGREVKRFIIKDELTSIDVTDLTNGNYIVNIANSTALKFVKKQ